MNPFEFPEMILRYAEEHTSDEDPVLAELYRQTYLKVPHPQMLSGKVLGQFLSFISRMVSPTRILEVGTYTGYSAYCLAKGLKKGGSITTIEVNEELESFAADFFERSGISLQVNFLVGDALEIIPGLDPGFELVFIDANKENYPEYYELCIEKLAPGGYIIADNVLWGGKVASGDPGDQSVNKIREFNDRIHSDPRVENVFITLRDGILLVRKK